ncbi:MAG: hypothetical protein IJ901_02275 [Bacteroidaceae bacterium]|nr:hypothetical protein [Bacteroidaceae bacterium]
MKSEDIDKIIAEAVNDSKKQSRWHRPERGRSTSIQSLRNVLNTVFMLGFVAALVVYFLWPEQKVLFFGIGFGAILIKLVEFYLRFMF